MSVDPLALFLDWYNDAKNGALFDPDVVALASADKQGRPSVRMVLYRGIREGGLAFFTNYESRKGRELTENPCAAMAFYWPHMGKQVRIEGSTARLSDKESDAYFRQRPVESQVTAAISRQSQPLLDELEFFASLDEAARNTPIVRPAQWGGFKLVPFRYEFWIHGEHRRHSRTLYEKHGQEWAVSQLYP